MVCNGSKGQGMVGQGRGIYKAAVVLLDEGGIQLCSNEGWMGGQALEKGLVSGQPTHLKGRQTALLVSSPLT